MPDVAAQPPMPQAPLPINPSEPQQDPPEGKSLLKRIIPSVHIAMPGKSLVAPIGVVLLVILIGGGSTYVVASSVFRPKSGSSQISEFSESDLPAAEDDLLPSPKAVATPTSTAQAPLILNLTPTPTTASSTANWSTYNFSQLFLTFKYPPGWFTNPGNTSGAPYMYVQSFPTTQTATSSAGNYSIYISRLEQVGITTTTQLSTQLALNAANSTYINGVNMGTTSVITSSPITINGYQALERTVTYSSAPGVTVYQLYVLDGVSNAVLFTPQLDTAGTRPFLNSLITTIDFTN